VVMEERRSRWRRGSRDGEEVVLIEERCRKDGEEAVSLRTL
jgi:hypothetical protein